jgi:hypothetical protein
MLSRLVLLSLLALALHFVQPQLVEEELKGHPPCDAFANFGENERHTDGPVVGSVDTSPFTVDLYIHVLARSDKSVEDGWVNVRFEF